jgi:hypothetical protein
LSVMGNSSFAKANDGPAGAFPDFRPWHAAARAGPPQPRL